MNLINSLFDLSFSNFVTSKFIRLIYVIALIWNAIVAFGLIIALFPLGFFVAPIVFVVMTVLARVVLETTVVLFRIAENVQEIAQTRRQDAPGAETLI